MAVGRRAVVEHVDALEVVEQRVLHLPELGVGGPGKVRLDALDALVVADLLELKQARPNRLVVLHDEPLPKVLPQPAADLLRDVPRGHDAVGGALLVLDAV